MDIPTIKTSRLTLRAFTAADAEPLYRLLGEEGILRYFPNPNPPALERVQRLIAAQLHDWEQYGYAWWAVEFPPHPELIGWCGLGFLPETVETEVAYLLAKPFWGQGLATEGARASLRYGFEQVGVETIVGIVHPENIASQRVLEKLGMSVTARTQYFGMDCYRYAIERASYRSGIMPA